MAERLAYEDTDKRIFVTVEATDEEPQQERVEWRPGREPLDADAVRSAARLDLDQRVRDDGLDDATVASVSALYPDWRQPEGAHDAYPQDAIVRHAGALWHSTVADNVHEPGTSGWHRHGPPEDGPQPWVQPSGGHDAYAQGDRVTHDGATWESDVDGNTWEPPEQWTEV